MARQATRSEQELGMTFIPHTHLTKELLRKQNEATARTITNRAIHQAAIISRSKPSEAQRGANPIPRSMRTLRTHF